MLGFLTLFLSLNHSDLIFKLTQTTFAVDVGTKCATKCDDELADGDLQLGRLLRAIAQKIRCHNSGLLFREMTHKKVKVTVEITHTPTRARACTWASQLLFNGVKSSFALTEIFTSSPALFFVCCHGDKRSLFSKQMLLLQLNN